MAPRFTEVDATQIITAGAAALGLSTTPANFSCDDLRRCYEAIREAAETYEQEIDLEERARVAQIARDTLDLHLEFQAAFTVLGIRGIPSGTALTIPPPERRTLYLQHLYAAPGDFSFFEERAKTLDAFVDAGILASQEQYRRPQAN